MAEAAPETHTTLLGSWQLVGLNTEALFEYLRNGKKLEDLSTTVTNLVRDSVTKVLKVWQGEQGGHASPASVLQAQQLYYRVLQFQLQSMYPITMEEQGRHRHRVVSPAAHTVLQRMDLHLGLLHCTMEVILASSSAADPQASGPTPSITDALNTRHLTPSIWEGARWFLDCFTGAASGCSMAGPLLNRLRGMQRVIEEELALAEGSSFWELLYTGGGGAHPSADMSLVSGLLASIAQGTADRVAQCVHALADSNLVTMRTMTQDQGRQLFLHLATSLADQVLAERLDLWFDVHQAVVVACIVYGVSKVLQLPDVSFNNLTTTLVQMWDGGITPSTLSAISVREHHQWKGHPSSRPQTSSQAGRPPPGGTCSVRSFYNAVFLPACEPMLLALKTAASAVPAGADVSTDVDMVQVDATAARDLGMVPVPVLLPPQPGGRTPLQEVRAAAVSNRLNSATKAPAKAVTKTDRAAGAAGQLPGVVLGSGVLGATKLAALGVIGTEDIGKENVEPKDAGLFARRRPHA